MRRARAILVVEDDPDLRDILRDMLAADGHDVCTARNGAEALRVLDGRPEVPHLILLDLMMPVMDGLEFLARLKLRPGPRHVVVVVTANGQLSDTVSEHDAVASLAKPFEATDLRRIVDQHLGL